MFNVLIAYCINNLTKSLRTCTQSKTFSFTANLSFFHKIWRKKLHRSYRLECKWVHFKCSHSQYIPTKTTILEKCPWNTFGIFNKIIMFMLNVDQNVQYWVLQERWASTNAYPFPTPRIIQCCDTLETLETP